jgi:hypothetical protein
MDCDTVRTGATVAAAIGTVGAVLYALYRDLILANRRRPRLDLLFDPTGPDAVVVGTLGGTDSAYVRLRVTNAKGKDTADDVQVLVTEVLTLDGSETTPMGLPLTWSGTFPPTTVGPVHPGAERYIDLLHVDWPAHDEMDIVRKWTGEEPAQLDVFPKPAGRQHVLAPGRTQYVVRVKLLARNADAVGYEIVVVWDGKWSGKAAMWAHLHVQPPYRAGD